MKIKSKVPGKVYRGRTIPTEFVTLSNPEATFGVAMRKIMEDFKADNDIIIDGEDNKPRETATPNKGYSRGKK